jgi:acyl-lipid omega-6 desaturase (Delta-12 desaturase)
MTENNAASLSAREWAQRLAKFRSPSTGRSLFELGITLSSYIGLLALALWVLPHAWLAALALSVLAGPFLVRLFAIQHDCGHGAFFESRGMSSWVGRALGVLTLTPYDVWKRAHAIHHSGAGNLDRRGLGDIKTITVAEYRALSPLGRLKYRAYRNPFVLFAIGPAYIFLIDNRLPFGLMRAGAIYWISAMSTNLAILALIAGFWAIGGWAAVLLVWLPSALVAATIGVWLFYVQHQFEATLWDHEKDWDMHEAALYGSSHYVLPQPLQWVTANIGIHHVHHLYSRIPFYRLPEVLAQHPELAQIQRMTIGESFANAKLHLWDEGSRQLLSWADARRVAG